MNQASALPTRKVGSGALAGAVTVIFIWIIQTFTGVEIPPEVASAITLVLMFAASYFVPEPEQEPVVIPVIPAEPVAPPSEPIVESTTASPDLDNPNSEP